MVAYEPRIFATNDSPAFAAMAKKLGWSAGCVVAGNVKDAEACRQAFEAAGMDMDVGVEAPVRPTGADKWYVVPKTMEAAKRAIEQGCDGLAGWWTPECGINFVLAKLAAEHKVPICFDIEPLLHASRRGRIGLFGIMSEAGRFVRKYKAPVRLSSGARSLWELRNPSDLLSFGRVLGLEDTQIKAGWK